MRAQSELLTLPQVLNEMFTRGRSERERAVRGIRWSDGPIYVLVDDRARSAGLLAQFAIEGLLHRPVIVREASSFLAYSAPTLRTGSPVVVISGQDESAELQEAVRVVRAAGGYVIAVAGASSPIAQSSHQVLTVPDVSGTPPEGLGRACLEHAAVGQLAIIAARLLARPGPALERIEKDWAEIPSALEKFVTQFENAVRSLAHELGAPTRILSAGAGSYYAAAMSAAEIGRPCPAVALDFASLRGSRQDMVGTNTGVVLLTGSRSPSREAAATLARELKARGASVFAVTDANDHAVAKEARLTLLLPDFAELPASILALVLAGWTTRETALLAAAAPEDAKGRRQAKQGI